MSTQLAPPRRFVKAYHRHLHLQLQFIWSELILSHNALMQAKHYTDLFHTEEDFQKNFRRLIAIMMRLAGSSQEYMRLLGSDDDGLFNKLKNYCILFSLQESSHNHKIHSAMVQEASKAWLLSVQALTILRIPGDPSASYMQSKIHPYIEKMKKCLTRLMRLMAKVALEFRSNENVVLFLVRHQKYLDNIMESDYVLSLLRKMFDKKLTKMREFLIHRYLERGFIHLVPFINTAVDRLGKNDSI